MSENPSYVEIADRVRELAEAGDVFGARSYIGQQDLGKGTNALCLLVCQLLEEVARLRDSEEPGPR